MKIAMLGLKGMPGIHGGVEKHAEQLGSRLVAKGHEVTLYCRRSYTPVPGQYMGMELKLLPTVNTKHMDATVHTLLGGFATAFSDYDLIHYHAIGPGSMSFIPRAFGKPVITTIHSLDYLRDKWGPFAKWALKRAEGASLRFANRIIVVSRMLEQRFRDCKKPVAYIPNGVSGPKTSPPRIIADNLGLQGGDYLFWAGRFSPEKGLHYLIDAFEQVDTPFPLVLAGGANHTRSYVKNLMKRIKKNPKILTPGFISGKELDELFTNAALFVLPSEHEGMPVALLEAMSYGAPCVVSDIPACREIGRTETEDFVDFFTPKDSTALATALSDALGNLPTLKQRAKKAQAHVVENYSWDRIADKVEAEYEKLLKGRK